MIDRFAEVMLTLTDHYRMTLVVRKHNDHNVTLEVEMPSLGIFERVVAVLYGVTVDNVPKWRRCCPLRRETLDLLQLTMITILGVLATHAAHKMMVTGKRLVCLFRLVCRQWTEYSLTSDSF